MRRGETAKCARCGQQIASVLLIPKGWAEVRMDRAKLPHGNPVHCMHFLICAACADIMEVVIRRFLDGKEEEKAS